MFYGYLNLSFIGYVVYVLITTQITIAAVTLYLHRCQSHRALVLHPAVCHFFRFWIWIGTGMSTRAWASIHRKHHAKCETSEDPHSPKVLGLRKVLWEGAELYKKEAKNKETLERYGAGTPNDWLENNVYEQHSGKGYFILLAVDVFLLGIPGVAVWALQMMWIPFFAAGIVNGVGHYFGYRNVDCNDASTNLLPLGIFIGGEELHNNHHTYPTSAKFSVKWWEFDIGWFYIKILSYLGLATPKKIPPQEQLIPGKKAIDVDTVKSIIANRFLVMTHYTNKVIAPIFKQERDHLLNYFAAKKDSKAFLEIKKLLLNNQYATVNNGANKKLKVAAKSADNLSFSNSNNNSSNNGSVQLDGSQCQHAANELHNDVRSDIPQVLTLLNSDQKVQSLVTAYKLRQQLQAIWDKTTATQKELIDALQHWCHEAEATGIKKLQEFVAYIKSYNLARINL